FVGSPVGRPPSPAPFPYTTLFRSAALGFDGNSPEPRIPAVQDVLHGFEVPQQYVRDGVSRRDPEWLRAEHRSGQPHDQEAVGVRSEEHTSELQSREKLVCRLLLEK